MIYFMKGIKKLGGWLSFSYTLIMCFLFIIIDNVILFSFESLFHMQHKVYFYDIFLMLVWVGIYLYGFIIVGKTEKF